MRVHYRANLRAILSFPTCRVSFDFEICNVAKIQNKRMLQVAIMAQCSQLLYNCKYNAVEIAHLTPGLTTPRSNRVSLYYFPFSYNILDLEFDPRVRDAVCVSRSCSSYKAVNIGDYTLSQAAAAPRSHYTHTHTHGAQIYSR